MSEFTSGNLLLSKDRNIIKQCNVSSLILKELNNKWAVFFTEDNYIESEVPNYIIEVSKECPILYFYNYEDYGWGYRIISKGEEVAKLMINYSLEDDIITEIIQQRYPEIEDIFEFIYDEDEGREAYEKIREEINTSN